MRAPLALLFLAACGDNTISKYDTPPNVAILSPADGEVVDANATVELYGTAADQQTSYEDLAISWSSSVDGELGTTPPDSDGNLYLAVGALTPGEHVITLTAVDSAAQATSTSIAITAGQGVVGGEGAPEIALLNPTSGANFLVTETVNVIATISDDADRPADLLVEILDVPDGLVWSGSPSMSGSISVPYMFSEGTHSLTLTAVDTEGHLGQAVVDFTVAGDGRPAVTIDAPVDGSSVSSVDVVTFSGTVSDDNTDPEVIAVSWTSDLQGVLSNNPANSRGLTGFSGALIAGTHTITLAATDSEGKEGRDTITLSVGDPNDNDDDGDGFSENEGDCDDRDPLANPGATDLCDSLDNDCDGVVNGSYTDTYEVNNTEATGYDVGTVDGFLWANDLLNLSGLTFSDPDDEDWFVWESNGDWLTEAISITASNLPSGGNYVMEFYNRDSGDIIDSDSGSSRLSVSYDVPLDDWFDDIPYAVRVYPATWPAGACGSTYTVSISM